MHLEITKENQIFKFKINAPMCAVPYKAVDQVSGVFSGLNRH